MEKLTIWPVEEFDKDFGILSKISEGKYGEVYLAKKKATSTSTSTLLKSFKSQLPEGFRVAVKFLKSSKASEKLHMREEIEILNELNHENILKLLGAYEDSESFIQIFEYLSGGDLFQRLMETGLPAEELQISGFIKQICSGCAHLSEHRIVHLDLKPENIVFVSQHSTVLKIIDFGFARRLLSGIEIRTNQGTPEFLSPEVVNCQPVTTTTDIWSVGVITYILLSGLSPFLGDTIQETCENISSCNYRLDEEPFETVSDAAKNFVRRLLVLDQNIRLTAQEALADPWLQNLEGEHCWDSQSRHKCDRFVKTASRLSRKKKRN